MDNLRTYWNDNLLGDNVMKTKNIGFSETNADLSRIGMPKRRNKAKTPETANSGNTFRIYNRLAKMKPISVRNDEDETMIERITNDRPDIIFECFPSTVNTISK